MRASIRVLGGLTVAAVAGLVLTWTPVTQHLEPAASTPAVTPVCRPGGPALPEWSTPVRQRLEAMHLPIRGERLDSLLETVDRHSRHFRIDPVTVLAVILVESRFDPEAVSPGGAIGLMQLRADTARELAQALGLPWASDDSLLDPDLNVLLGTYYLSRLIHRFGDLDAAFAAFHDGPGKIEACRDQTGSVPLDYPDRIWDAIVRLRIRAIA